MSKNSTRKAASTGESPGDSGATKPELVSGLTWQRCSVCREHKPEMLIVDVLADCSYSGVPVYRCQSCPEPEPAACECGAVPVYGWCKACRLMVIG